MPHRTLVSDIGALRDSNGTPFVLKQRVVQGEVVWTFCRQAHGFLEEVFEVQIEDEALMGLLLRSAIGLERAVMVPQEARQAVLAARKWQVQGSP